MSFFRRIKDWKAIRRWESTGRSSAPPPVVKQRLLRELAQRHDLGILVETGTFKGDMIAAMKKEFRELYSIELVPHFFERSVQRFVCDPHITILKGDSGKVLKTLVPKLTVPTLFWLDAHDPTGDVPEGGEPTPVMRELENIFSCPDLKSVIVIDDASCFTGGGGRAFPSVETVRNFVTQHRPDYSFEIDTDCIRLAPKS